MLETYIISVNSNVDDDNVDNHSHNSIKYKKRREYVKKQIIPKLDFLNIQIFDAITPNDFILGDDYITYVGKNFKRGLDWNTKKYPDLYLNSITLSSYILYQKTLLSNKASLILQDDLYIPSENITNIKNAIFEFLKIETPSILYLQSECPWKEGFPLRTYSNNSLTFISDNLSLIDKEWYDIAGNVGYVINKSGAKIMIDLIDSIGLSNDDQLTTIAMKNGLLNIYTCTNHSKMILLNKKLQ